METPDSSSHLSAPSGDGADGDISRVLAEALSEIARLFRSHLVSTAQFRKMVEEVQTRDLAPRGHRCLVRVLGDGTVRFLIKEGEIVRQMIDCGSAGQGRDGEA